MPQLTIRQQLTYCAMIHLERLASHEPDHYAGVQLQNAQQLLLKSSELIEKMSMIIERGLELDSQTVRNSRDMEEWRRQSADVLKEVAGQEVTKP